MRLWHNRPHTILFVTHDLREAIALADKLIFLSAKPMRIIEQITIPLNRTERNNEQQIDTIRAQLINAYPTIQGLL
jgi:NitT/TauT family transport system ATP-binding protein